MSAIFTPAIRLMHRLRYPQKFLLVGLLLVLPLLLVMSQYLAGINFDIDFAEKEQLGLDYNEPVLDLLQVVQRHAALSSAERLNPELTFDEQILAEQEAAQTFIAEIDKVDQQLGEQFEVSQDWE